MQDSGNIIIHCHLERVEEVFKICFLIVIFVLTHYNVIAKEVIFMFDYMSVKEAAEKWGLSERRIQVLCATNRIPDVMQVSHIWLIPKTASKPKDGRFKNKTEEV